MASDPIGTVRFERHDDGHSVWVRIDDPITEGAEWTCVSSTAPRNVGCMMGTSLAGWARVIGAVPGTPAAVSAEQAVSSAVASAHLSGVDLPADWVETVGKVARGEVTADDAVHAVVDSGLRDKLAQGLHNQHCEKAFTDCVAVHWHDWREQADILMEWAVGPAIDDAGQEVKRLRAELEKAHVFIGEMVLADMEPPLPPYGSEERAEAERVQPDTEATEQAASSTVADFVLYPPMGWLNRVDEVLRYHGAADRDGSAVGEALGTLIRSWRDEQARHSPDYGPEEWGPRDPAAEARQADPGWCGTAPRCPSRFVYGDSVFRCQREHDWHDNHENVEHGPTLTVSWTTDSALPRESRHWYKHDEPPPLDVKKVRHDNSQVFTRVGPNGWRAGAGPVITGEQLIAGIGGYKLTEVTEDGTQ